MKSYEPVGMTEAVINEYDVPVCIHAERGMQNPDAAQTVQTSCQRDVVSDFLMSHGIYPHLLGYRYLRSALLRGLECPYFFDNITQVCYPLLAEEFHTNAQSVERAIRHALLRAEERSVSETAKAWGHCTNREFLVRACEYICIMMK